MVNISLTSYLERHMAITKFQSGFRRYHSVDADILLITLETLIMVAFVGRKYLVPIFSFNLEKVYDTTWNHGVLFDLYKTKQ